MSARLVAILTGVAAVSAFRCDRSRRTHTARTFPGRPTRRPWCWRPSRTRRRWYGRHATFDRVVVDLSRPVTGCRVGSVDKLRYAGSGEAVPLSGQAFPAINVDPADAHASVGQAALHVYSGPRLTRPGLPTVNPADGPDEQILSCAR